MSESPANRKIQNLWTIVLIELTSACNFSCEFCPSDQLKRGRTFMPRDQWQKILDELSSKRMCHKVFFHLMGEPTLHKDFFDAVVYANDKGLTVSVYTNGALLDDKKADELLSVLKKGGIVLSLQDINSQGFEKRSRGQMAWNDYLNRLKNFMIKADARGTHVEVHVMVDPLMLGWDFFKIGRVQKRIQQLYSQWQTALKGQSISKVNVLDSTRWYPLGQHASFHIKHRGAWSNAHLPSGQTVIPLQKGHCSLMRDTFTILSNGECTYCCSDFEGNLSLGNAFTQSLEDIYYGPKSQGILDAEKHGEFVQPFCQLCQGRVVNEKTRRSISNRNMLVNFYLFRSHLKVYGFKSAIKKAIYALRKQ